MTGTLTGTVVVLTWALGCPCSLAAAATAALAAAQARVVVPLPRGRWCMVLRPGCVGCCCRGCLVSLGGCGGGGTQGG
jgi:hypothetical protein